MKEAVEGETPCRCGECGGLVKPDIVFFGESLPEHFFRRATADFPAADLLIVMGTSLVVNPFASLIGALRCCSLYKTADRSSQTQRRTCACLQSYSATSQIHPQLTIVLWVLDKQIDIAGDFLNRQID